MFELSATSILLSFAVILTIIYLVVAKYIIDEPEPDSVNTEVSNEHSSNIEPNVFALRVVFPEEISDNSLLDQMLQLNLKLGEHDIFHDQGESYSVASLREPGTFNLDLGIKAEGFNFFMRVDENNREHALENFEKMLRSARHIAASFNGKIYGTDSNEISARFIESIREQLKVAAV